MSTDTQRLVFEDDFATIEQADFCAVPGYLVLRLKTGAHSLGELDVEPERAHRLGALLASAVAAIEIVLRADRVYTLSFCEVDRRLHFHLFPRTAALLALYQEATGTAGQEVDGPRLFEWARTTYGAGNAPPGSPSQDELCEALRELLPRWSERE